MLQAYSVQHFQKMNSFTDVFFKNFAYFFGITILRNISEWQGSNAVLNHKEQMNDEKKGKLLKPKLSRYWKSVYGLKITSKEMSLQLTEAVIKSLL